MQREYRMFSTALAEGGGNVPTARGEGQLAEGMRAAAFGVVSTASCRGRGEACQLQGGGVHLLAEGMTASKAPCFQLHFAEGRKGRAN